MERTDQVLNSAEILQSHTVIELIMTRQDHWPSKKIVREKEDENT